MALTSKYINKLSGYLSIIKPVISCPQVLTAPNNQREQNYRYLFAQCNTVETPSKNNTKDYLLTDNRESLNDIVTKVKLPKTTSIDKIYKDSICLKCSKSPTSDTPGGGRPSAEALENTYKFLAEQLPTFFTHPFNFSIYHKDIIFEDNIRNIRTNGILQYVKQMQLIKIFAHIRFAFVKLEVLKITKHPEDGTVKVRWKITGVSGLSVLFKFWKYKLWNYREIFNKPEIWYDGFSTFYLNSQGQVVKHVADKMMPDSDTMTTEATTATLGAAKLAIALGLIPKIYDVSSSCPLPLP